MHIGFEVRARRIDEERRRALPRVETSDHAWFVRWRAPAPAPRVPVRAIIATVAAIRGMTPRMLLERTRRAEIAHPRQLAMYLACRLSGRSLPLIARAFGGFDHTTVLYARHAVAARLQADPVLAAEVRAIEGALIEGSRPVEPEALARAVRRALGQVYASGPRAGRAA